VKLPGHKTKIVCTIGPASRSDVILREMIKSGMNVARLNFSHADLDDHSENIRRIRSASAQIGSRVTIMADLPGPKIRIGTLRNEPLVLKKGDIVTLTTHDIVGTATRIPVNYPGLPQSVSKGSIIYLNDGFLQLRVQDRAATEVRCKVLIGGQLLSNKGLNLPRAKISVDAVTDKDLGFIDFGLKQGIDTFSVSFVEKAADILKAKEFAAKMGKSIYVVAKIERAEAAKNIDEILEVADAIMIARGDLGVQTPIEEVPVVQKKLIRRANLLGCPVITATQMLESMTDNIRPTRAEVTDVANAILDGTDAVMLSEETAIGKYPVETVKMMARIAASIERQRWAIRLSSGMEEYFTRGPGSKNLTVEDVVSLNVIKAVRALKIRLIVTPTDTGSTPRRMSRFKPDCWILAFSGNQRTHDFLTLSYGVYPSVIQDKVDSRFDAIIKFIKDFRAAKKGDLVILTQGTTVGKIGGTDSFRILTLS
jgi:pyruvate kinase